MYRLLSSQQQAAATVGSWDRTEQIWKKLRKIHVPPKVRSFWWRVIKDFVPTRQALKHRKMERLSVCEACGKTDETIFHALFDCTWARLFWQEMKSTTGLKIPTFHPRSWAMDMIDDKELKEEDRASILCSCWSIWRERNKRRHGEEQRSIQESIKWVLQTTVDLFQIGKGKKNKSGKMKVRWKPPEQGWVKINTDASYLKDT
jgi:hypothetical protein